MEPTPLPQANAAAHQAHRRQYFTGLAIGFIPVILTWIVPAYLLIWHPTGAYAGLNAAIAFLVFAAIAYLGEAIIMIALLADPLKRFVGYGLLTLILTGPVISYMGCVVVPQLFIRH